MLNLKRVVGTVIPPETVVFRGDALFWQPVSSRHITEISKCRITYANCWGSPRFPKQHPEKNSFAASTVVLVKKLWRTATCLGAIFLEIWDRFIVSRFITWLICLRILFCRLMLVMELPIFLLARREEWWQWLLLYWHQNVEAYADGAQEHDSCSKPEKENIFSETFSYSSIAPLSNGFQSVIIYLTS